MHWMSFIQVLQTRVRKQNSRPKPKARLKTVSNQKGHLKKRSSHHFVSKPDALEMVPFLALIALNPLHNLGVRLFAITHRADAGLIIAQVAATWRIVVAGGGPLYALWRHVAPLWRPRFAACGRTRAGGPTSRGIFPAPARGRVGWWAHRLLQPSALLSSCSCGKHNGFNSKPMPCHAHRQGWFHISLLTLHPSFVLFSALFVLRPVKMFQNPDRQPYQASLL